MTICFVGSDKDIQVFRGPWFGMGADGVPSDNNIKHVMVVECGQEFFMVFAQSHPLRGSLLG